MSLTIEEYLKFKKEYQDDMVSYISEKKAQFENKTGLEVQDIFVYTSEIASVGDGDKKFIITDVKIQTKLSD